MLGSFALLALVAGPRPPLRHLRATSHGARAGGARYARNYAGLPQSFEPNRGQTDPRVDFVSHGRGYSLFLAGGDATLLLTRGENPRSATALRMRLVGADAAARASGAERLPGTVN